MDTWVQVDKFEDGDSVNAATLNIPVDQLAARTEYLKRRIGSIINSGIQSALILRGVQLDPSDAKDAKIGSIMYMHAGSFGLAQAKMHLYDNLWETDNSAFTIGVLVEKYTTTGDVLIYGKLDIGADPRFHANDMLQSGEKLQEGRYYLSATEPGKITAKPGGPIIYIGSFHSKETTDGEFAADAIACINPQFMDIGTSHVHRSYRLVARPAGNIVNGELVGHLPDTHSRPGKKYPSLVFGGTWLERFGVDTEYKFFLSSSGSWGEVSLTWKKNGLSEVYGPVSIPAPGVFVDLDNGLKVKVLFPEASSSSAFSGLSDSERTWSLTFPHAGKGWVGHSVEAIAEQSDASTSPDDSGVHVLLYGSWPSHDNTVGVYFPEKLYSADLGANVSNLGKVEFSGEKYEFVSEGDAPTQGYVAVDKAATVSESLANLAREANSGKDTPSVMHFGNKIAIACDSSPTIDGAHEVTEHEGGDFDVIGGTVKLMVVYDAEYEMLGDIVKNASTYSPKRLGNLFAEVFATNATSAANVTCETGSVFSATAYDYAPAAVYDYAMGLHQSVDYYFPPVPAQAAGLFVNGVEMENAALFPDNPTYVVGRKTLHWMEDDIEHLPWPSSVTSRDGIVDPADDKTIDFHFVVGFQCATGPVTSIIPAPDSAIKVYTYGTNEEAHTGDLMIDAALDFHVADAGVKGFNVAKKGKGGKLLAGAVVERIRGGAGITVTQDAGCPAGQGTVTVSLENGTLRDRFDEIALENAKQEKIGLFPYISLLGMGDGYGSIPSAFTMMMRVPTDLDPESSYRMNIRTTMFGTAEYSGMYRRVAGVKLEYNILPDYTGDTHASLRTGLVFPANPRHLKIPLGHETDAGRWEYVGYDPFVATTEDDISAPKTPDVCVPLSLSDTGTWMPIPSVIELPNEKLKPGYLVAIRMSREEPSGTDVSSDIRAYTAPLGFLSLEWMLEEA